MWQLEQYMFCNSIFNINAPNDLQTDIDRYKVKGYNLDMFHYCQRVLSFNLLTGHFRTSATIDPKLILNTKQGQRHTMCVTTSATSVSELQSV